MTVRLLAVYALPPGEAGGPPPASRRVPRRVSTESGVIFSFKDRAFHYLRVLEIPTPRWTAYETKNDFVTSPGIEWSYRR